MRIVTCNLRLGGRGHAHIAHIVDELDPTILLLQEARDPKAQLADLDQAWRVHWSCVEVDGVSLSWGSAVAARHHSATPISLSTFEGSVSGVQLHSWKGLWDACRTVSVFSIHAPKRGSYPKAVHQILDEIVACTDLGDVVIGGDFNLTLGVRHSSEDRPTSAADIEIQERLRDQFGLVNCWQEANADVPLTQTLRWSREPAFPYHCDGLFVPRSWKPHLIACDVIIGEAWDALSDHNPVVATFSAACASHIES